MSPAAARAFPVTTTEAELINRWLDEMVLGDPAQVAHQLEKLRVAAGGQELMITTHIGSPAARQWSYEHLAAAYGLTG